MQKNYVTIILAIFQFFTLSVFADNGVSLRVVSSENGIALLGTSDKVDLQVINESDIPIASIGYVIITKRKTSPEMHINFDTPLSVYNNNFALSVDVPADDEAGYFTKKIRITKVNEQANLSASNEAEMVFYTVTNLAQRRVVMEEYTGIWCGFCPKGEAALNRIDDEYGSKVVSISIHQGDVLESEEYTAAGLMPGSYPKASLNRILTKLDPYKGTATGNEVNCAIRNDIDRILKKSAEASVECAPQWTNDSRTAINPNAEITFYFNNRSSRYAVGYVLLEDGMSGSGKNWAQSNYFTNNNYSWQFIGDEYMREFLEGPEYIYGKIYDRVAVAAFGIQRGLPSSIPSPIVADEVFSHDFQVAATSEKIQNKDNLRLAVLLFNINTGEIINAAMAKIGENSYTGIKRQDENQLTIVARYSANGMQIETPQRGINILRMSDGSIKKVVVK